MRRATIVPARLRAALVRRTMPLRPARFAPCLPKRARAMRSDGQARGTADGSLRRMP